MANWSQSHFLQSLGWATLNSFWQMALLWFLFISACYFFRISSHRKYQLAVCAIVTGFVWFVITFLYFFQSSSVSTISFFNQPIEESNKLLNIFLISASVAYLSLLVFPSYKLYKNWLFVQRVRKQSLLKADLNYRLFVQKIAAHLGINKKVMVFLSDLVKSPLTIGYLKPIIILPIAALNNLSAQQVEAILLHELSHIRRYDYLVNLIISIINTILYFNPFVKQFMKTIEEERENCCDQLVLQFGYDKVSYASALLSLEKMSLRNQVLAIGATGKKHLLNRIEKIVGMEKKKGFSKTHFAGMIAALICIVAFNSILIIKEKNKATGNSFAYENLANPFSFSGKKNKKAKPFTNPSIIETSTYAINSDEKTVNSLPELEIVEVKISAEEEAKENDLFTYVAFDEVEASLTPEEKETVKSTVDATKKIYSTMQWNAVEKNIADVLTKIEKEQVKEEYLTELNKKIDWKNVEENMKAQFQNLDLNSINIKLSKALNVIQLDSLHKTYTTVLAQLEKANVEVCSKAKVSCAPLPDQSVQQLNEAEAELKKRLEIIKDLRNPKKVVVL